MTATSVAWQIVQHIFAAGQFAQARYLTHSAGEANHTRGGMAFARQRRWARHPRIWRKAGRSRSSTSATRRPTGSCQIEHRRHRRAEVGMFRSALSPKPGDLLKHRAVQQRRGAVLAALGTGETARLEAVVRSVYGATPVTDCMHFAPPSMIRVDGPNDSAVRH